MFDVHAKCCRTTWVRFLLNSAGKGCGDYDGDFEESSQCPHALGRLCSKKLCGNGKRVAEGIHCGKGSCNSFGCNCDGGCIEGDPEQNLLKQYPPSIAWRCYSIFSETSELSLGWSKPLSLVIRYVCCTEILSHFGVIATHTMSMTNMDSIWLLNNFHTNVQFQLTVETVSKCN